MRKLMIIISMCFVVLLSSCTWFNHNPEKKSILTVGSNDIAGYFLDGFGNNQADVWVRTLIHGYSTYAKTPYGEIVLNETVVKHLETSIDPITNHKTYAFTIYDDLYWSDGEPITANDFLFCILLFASSEWKSAGFMSSMGEKLIGYADYRQNPKSEDTLFSGVKRIDLYQFSLTIDATYLPYFYETLFVNVYPLPLHHLAPMVGVINSDDDGSSMQLDGFDMISDMKRIGGYIYQPTVTAGAYQFDSFLDQTVTLSKNNRFKGDYRGQKPKVDTIIIKNINTYPGIQKVIDNAIDLYFIGGDDYQLELANATQHVETGYFVRNGYGFLAPSAHFGPTKDYRVRQAIAYLTDNESVIEHILGGHSDSIFSDYGSAQWMVERSKSWMEENLDKYTFSIDEAHRVLDQSEWIFESDGITPFNRDLATDNGEYLRYNANKEALLIHNFRTYTGGVGDYFQFEKPMHRAGIKYVLTYGPFDELLEHLYYAYNLDEIDKKYHLFHLALNYSESYDPYTIWHSDQIGTWSNYTQFEDRRENLQAPLGVGEFTLDELMVMMRQTDPNDKEAYLALWRLYQKRWNLLMPVIPIYANYTYYAYNQLIQNLTITYFWDWTHAMMDVVIAT